MIDHAWSTDSSLPRSLVYAFAPLHKRALGVAAGITVGGLIALVTMFHVAVDLAEAPNLGLLAQYFYGYTVSWIGAAVGFFWGFVVGFVTGWFIAFTRNLTLAIWLLYVRSRANLSQPFLDHI
jgi:hypothetical protein